jgi:hypothetical protein
LANSDGNLRRRGTAQGQVLFTELTMAAILGVTIVEATSSFGRDLSVGNYRAILLAAALVLFVEMYIVHTRYHRLLHMPYPNVYIFVDLAVAFAFVSFVHLVGNSWDKPSQIRDSLIMLAILFAALFIRQLLPYLSLLLRPTPKRVADLAGGEAAAVVNNRFGVHASYWRLQLILLIPILADIAGIFYAIVGMQIGDAYLVRLSWLGLIAVLVYELIMLLIAGVHFRGGQAEGASE